MCVEIDAGEARPLTGGLSSETQLPPQATSRRTATPTNEAIWLSALWYGLQYHWLCDRQSVDVAEQSRHHLEDVLPQR